MLTLDELHDCPRKQRRPAIVEFLSHALADASDVTVARRAVYDILDLGSRWRHDIFALAKAPDTPDDVRQLLIGYVRSVTGRSVTIPDRPDILHRQEVCPLLHALQHCRIPREHCYLTVNFASAHASVTTFAAIAAWASRNAHTVEFAYTKRRAERLKSFLDRIDIAQAVCTRSAEPFRFDDKGTFGFLRIDPGAENMPQLIDQLVESFHSRLSLQPRIAAVLTETLNSLIDNVLQHARIDSPAWLFASHHPKPAGIRLAVCDLGVGIKKTFRDAQDDKLRELADHPTAWLKQSAEPGVSTTGNNQPGIGLSAIKKFCRENTAPLLIISGDASHQLAGRTTARGEARFDQSTNREKTTWQGTLVALELPLQRPHNPLANTQPPPT
ncbi:MAG: hypothetical protein KAS72_02770 [Phycisphaerales bacterium]|nr:hypothetical protein [Phycisphaerales bacterium]